MTDQVIETAADDDALAALRASTDRRVNALAQLGVNIDTVILGVQMAALVDIVIGDDPEHRQVYERRVLETVAGVLGQVEAQVRQAQILAPGGGPLMR
jgi:hypothetical protein